MFLELNAVLSGPLIFRAAFCPARCGPMTMWGFRALGSGDALEAETLKDGKRGLGEQSGKNVLEKRNSF